MKGARRGPRWPARHWLPQVLASGLLLVLASVVIASANDPKSLPRHYSDVSGTLSSTGVIIEDLQLCGCWTGLNGQSQKKVKFKITNNTTDTWVYLEGGPNSHVHLVVSYADSFRPVLKMPNPDAGTSQVWLPPAGTPPNTQVKAADEIREVDPIAIEAPALVTELGVEQGWTAWLLPANPAGIVQRDPHRSNMVTFPTMVGQEWLAPGESYYDDRLGFGDWVFYLPLPPEAEWMATSDMMPTTSLESAQTDKSYKILGVAIVDDDGRLLGFAPVPPETVWSSASDF